jgi:hypothetical protein
MRFLMLLSVATLAGGALSAPAWAEHMSGSPGSGFHDGDHHDGDGRDGRDHRRHRDGVFFAGPWVSEGWALYNNRSWDSGSFNDWWHDRPDRAYPRWVQDQRASGTCEPDRMWWSGSGWHC